MAYDWITDALESTWLAISRLLANRSEEELHRETPCPGWRVIDVVAHLVGFEAMLRGAPVPSYTGDYPDYVRNPIGELNEAFIADYRTKPTGDVLNEFVEVGRASIRHLRSLPLEEWERVGWSPEGDRPYHRFMETRVLDSWIHLQDMRDALLEPDDDHGPGEEIVVNRFEAALPYVLAKRVGLGEGDLVRVNLSGRLARSVALTMREGKVLAGEASDVAPVLEIATPVALFWRRAAGRITADSFLAASATDVRGDLALARRFSEGLAIMI